MIGCLTDEHTLSSLELLATVAKKQKKTINHCQQECYQPQPSRNGLVILPFCSKISISKMSESWEKKQKWQPIHPIDLLTLIRLLLHPQPVNPSPNSGCGILIWPQKHGITESLIHSLIIFNAQESLQG